MSDDAPFLPKTRSSATETLEAAAARLKPTLLDLLGQPERLQAMSAAAAALARPDAAANIGAELLALGRTKQRLRRM